MEIAEYLKQAEARLSQARRWIKDFRVFDFNHIPQKPLMRDETRPIIDALVRYEATGIPNHLLVFGSRGCGKTLMLKYVSRILERQDRPGPTFAYVNCRHHNTSFKILAHLLGVKPRGCSLAELWNRFCERHDRRVVFVLDEVDLISDKDRRMEILYLISRSPQNYMAVLLSNNPRFLNSLDESIRSTLQPELIHFRNYGAEEILEILRERAQAGIVRPLSKALPQIAALVAKHTNSDVRVAIKTLYYFALQPKADLKQIFEQARRDIVRDVIADLTDPNLLILKAAGGTDPGHVKSVYERYRELSRQVHEEPFSYVYFYSSLSYLQSLGLILLLSTKVGRAYTNRIQLLFDPEVLDSIWATRMR